MNRRVRAVDEGGAASTWIAFGGNPEETADFSGIPPPRPSEEGGGAAPGIPGWLYASLVEAAQAGMSRPRLR